MYCAIVTRLNVRHEDRRNLDPEWIERRLILFERYCVPSVKAQTVEGFRWFVIVDGETPAREMAVFRELGRAHGFLLIRCYERLTPQFVQSLISDDVWDQTPRDSKGEDVLCTIRLDSDDALSTRYVEKLCTLERKPRYPTLVNMVNGLEWDHEEGVARTTMRRCNWFAAMVEPYAGGHPLTAYAANGKKLAEYAKVVDLQGPPSWLKVKHAWNEIQQAPLSTVVNEDADVNAMFGLEL